MPAIAGLICVGLGGLALTRATISWDTVQTAGALTLTGLVPTEVARYRARISSRSVDTPSVTTAPVWIIGAVLTLPLAAVLLVSAALHAHELLRGGGRDDRGRVLASTGGATLAWVAASVTSGTVAAVLAGGLYVAVTDGPALLRAARRRVLGEHPDVSDASGDSVARAALGVLLGLFAPFSALAAPIVLLPVAFLQRSARGRALRHAAAHDPKTQLWNHAAWQTLSSAALASRRTSAVLMVDLDHFKRLNDTYGHQAGDDVLTCVAHVLQNATRRTDIVARFGGEEFSILLPGVTEQEAWHAAERIRDQIAALTVATADLDGSPVTIAGITASIGVATTHRSAACVDDLLVNADRWLYQAKEGGRNRVCGPTFAAA